MVEGQRPRLGERDPIGGGGVVGPGGLPRPSRDQERDRRRRFARISIGPGIDSHDLERAAGEAGLFPELADERFFDRLAKFNESPRESPKPPERGPTATDQQNFAGPDPNGVHGEGGIFVPMCHGAATSPDYLGRRRLTRARIDRSVVSGQRLALPRLDG